MFYHFFNTIFTIVAIRSENVRVSRLLQQMQKNSCSVKTVKVCSQKALSSARIFKSIRWAVCSNNKISLSEKTKCCCWSGSKRCRQRSSIPDQRRRHADRNRSSRRRNTHRTQKSWRRNTDGKQTHGRKEHADWPRVFFWSTRGGKLGFRLPERPLQKGYAKPDATGEIRKKGITNDHEREKHSFYV